MKPDHTKYKEYQSELYKIFCNFGIDTKEEFDKLIKEIKCNRKKTSGFLYDLMMYAFVKKGLKYKHLIIASKLLGHNSFRNEQLREQLNYFNTLLNK